MVIYVIIGRTLRSVPSSGQHMHVYHYREFYYFLPLLRVFQNLYHYLCNANHPPVIVGTLESIDIEVLLFLVIVGQYMACASIGILVIYVVIGSILGIRAIS